MLNCTTFQQLAQSFLDGDLNPELAASVEEHSAHCYVCHECLIDYRSLYAILDGLIFERAPADLTVRVLAALQVGP